MQHRVKSVAELNYPLYICKIPLYIILGGQILWLQTQIIRNYQSVFDTQKREYLHLSISIGHSLNPYLKDFLCSFVFLLRSQRTNTIIRAVGSIQVILATHLSLTTAKKQVSPSFFFM